MGPPLCGRADELARLARAVERAAAGTGGAVLVSGEPGVGKTRMARETVELARGRGFLVLEGQAYAMETNLAYGLVSAALGGHLRSLDERGRARALGGSRELARLFAPAEDGERTAAVDGNQGFERTQLFEATARLLARLAAERPVLLFLDDLHWADAASLELIHFAARHLQGARFLLVGTFRAATEAPLVALVRSFRRLGLLEEVALGRLDHQATTALTAALLEGAAVPAPVAAMLEARSGGVPLFVETLVRALVESGRLVKTNRDWMLDPDAATVLPPVIRDLITERIERIAGEPRRLLDLLAVSGEALPHRVLLAATGLPEATVADAVATLARAALASEVDGAAGAAYAPTHPLILEVVYQALPAAARARAHLLLADTFERLGLGEVGRLARHHQAAGAEADPRRSFALQLQAAEEALALGGYHEAAGFFAGALALCRRGTAPERLPQVLERLGEAWQRSGRGPAAINAWTEALTLRQRAGDPPPALARLRRLLASAEWDCGHIELAASHLDAGVASLDDGAELADLLFAQVQLFERTPERARHEQAVARLAALAALLGDRARTIEARLAQARLRAFQLDHAGALALLEETRHEIDDGREPRLAFAVGDARLTVLTQVGTPQQIRAQAEELLALRRGGLAAPAEELRARGALLVADLIAGEWTRAETGIDAMMAFAARYEIPRIAARGAGMRAWLAVMRGELAAARATLEQGRAVLAGGQEDRRAFTFLDWVDALIAVENDDQTHAAAIAPALEARDGELLARRLATRGDIDLMCGRLDEAASRAAEVEALGAGVFVGVFGVWLAARVLGARGDAAGARRRLREVIERLEGAGAALEVARARLDLAAVSAKPAEGIALAERSLAELERLGARRHADRARKQLRAAGARPAPRRRPGPGGGPLSQRELEVARLYAEGLTTAEVARRLVISPFTAKTHLQRVYERLGVDSRAALARTLAERQLL